MQAFVDEAEPVSPPSRRDLPVSTSHARRSQRYSDFRKVLIDRVLAEHYSFTDEELDFIINYDIKYRMGLGSCTHSARL